MLNKDISPVARYCLLGILFLSGANGLMMEIVFRRQLLLSLGVTHYSVATVLTVFMAGLALGSFFLAGFAALSLEVHWTRILAYVVGSHGYAFGIILAAFLCGIALGSPLVARFVDRLKRPALWLGSTQLLIAGTAFAASIIMFRLRGLTGWLTLQVGDSWDRFITAEWDVNP